MKNYKTIFLILIMVFVIVPTYICIDIYKKDIAVFAMEKISDYRGWKNNPKISVLMPTYNRKKFLPRSIDSILNQTYKNFEFIIVDDGSTDSSWKLLFKYLINDSRVRVYFNGKNRGRSYSRNRLFDLSKSEYLAIMDSDDFSLPHRLIAQYSYMLNHKDIDVTFGFMKTNGETNEDVYIHRPSGEMMLNLVFNIPLPHITMMVHKTFLNKHNIRYSYNAQAEDHDLYYQMFVNGGKFYVIQDFLADARIHKTNSKKYYKGRGISFDTTQRKFQAIFFGDDEKLFDADMCTKLKKIQESNKTLKLLEDKAIKRAVDWECYDKRYGYDEI